MKIDTVSEIIDVSCEDYKASIWICDNRFSDWIEKMVWQWEFKRSIKT